MFIDTGVGVRGGNEHYSRGDHSCIEIIMLNIPPKQNDKGIYFSFHHLWHLLLTYYTESHSILMARRQKLDKFKNNYCQHAAAKKGRGEGWGWGLGGWLGASHRQVGADDPVSHRVWRRPISIHESLTHAHSKCRHFLYSLLDILDFWDQVMSIPEPDFKKLELNF